MAYTYKIYGKNSLWNLRQSDDSNPVSPNEIQITNHGPTVAEGRVVIQGYDIRVVTTGTFQYEEPALTVGQASGMVSSMTVYKDGQMHEFKSWSNPVSLASTINGSFAEEMTWLAGNDLFVGSSTANEEDYMQGLSGDDTFIGYGSGQYGDNFYGGAGIDTAVFSGRQNEYSVASVDYMWDGRLANGGSINGIQVTDKVAERDGVDYLNEAGIYRFFNSSTGSHFYSGTKSEIDNILTNLPQFRFEGVSFDKNLSQDENSLEIYRFFNTATGTHFYTGSVEERDNVLANLDSFNYEATAYHAYSTKVEGTTELYRFYNTQTGTHFYTANVAEMQNVNATLSGVYNYEGVAYYVDVA